jgi:hypothetical protein
VSADLAEETPEGFRIKGTKGRIEWLAKRRDGLEKARSVAKNTKASVDCTVDRAEKASVNSPVGNSNSNSNSSCRDPGSYSDAREGEPEPEQLDLVASEPAIDVEALHDSLYFAYPKSKREDKAKGLDALKATVKTPEDVARLKRVFAAHLAQASEDKYVKAWFRFCANWHKMPEVAPSRGAPAKTAQAPTTGSAAPPALVREDWRTPIPPPRREDHADEAAFRVAHAAWCKAEDEREDLERREAGRIEREKFEGYRAEAARREAERAERAKLVTAVPPAAGEVA